MLIQSFEVGNLRELDRMTDLPLEQLVDCHGRAVRPGRGRRPRTYADMIDARRAARRSRRTPTGSARTRTWSCRATPAPAPPAEPTPLVDDAHRAGLQVVVYTLRDENQFMATDFRRGTDPNAKGDIAAEIHAFLDAGVDALFADYPDAAVAARDDWDPDPM